MFGHQLAAFGLLIVIALTVVAGWTLAEKLLAQ